MNKFLSIASLAALAIATPVIAQEADKPEFPSPNAIVEAAPASDWEKIDPSDLLIMDLAPDTEGNPRRVVIQLMPPPFSQGWIRNIRKLAETHWWDGTSINRVQDNYVVQWGDASEKKALPEGLETVPESGYETEATTGKQGDIILWHPKNQLTDSYSDWTWFESGWPLAQEIGDDTRTLSRWPVHCYGAVGVGRNYSPDTGSGAELYTVIGHAPRHLDRNIAVVGRIIEGMEYLSSLPRGKGQLGFYEDASKRVPITSIRLGDALAEDPAPAFEYLDTRSEVFAKYADARANRRDPFFIKPAGGADICNIPVPVRRVKAE